MPISTVWILKYVQQCYFKWFWTISSLGAPGFCQWVQNQAQQILLSCRNFAPIHKVFNIIGFLDLTFTSFMAFIFWSKTGFFKTRDIPESVFVDRLIMHSKRSDSQCKSDYIVKQKIMILYLFFKIIFTWQIRASTIWLIKSIRTGERGQKSPIH